ncbi:MAG: CDP-diacylglycerol---glycerol-3-phosphate 3-phosphatidyltransferase [Pseudonocardiales bacterium]|nr:CDP-diacylglycerol---glycerol-3-phosphate 3-phosphatidyltransferase [Pseudonocardiales bacterium]
MLNIHARDAVGKAVDPLGARLARAGVTANVITVIGTCGVVGAALGFFTIGWWFTGTLVITGFVLLDIVDGAVARAGGTASPFGGVLDSTADRIADAAVFGSLCWYFARHDQPGPLLAALLCLVLGSLTSYIRARAEAAGMNATVGIAERAERLIVVLVGTGLTGAPFRVPYVQAIALWLLVGASAITVVQRLIAVYRQSHGAEA